MGFNAIIDPMPDSFSGHRINTDFRQGLRFFAAMADKTLSDQERGTIVVRLFFPETIPDSAEEAWRFIEHFISGGDEKRGASGPKLFDFNADAGRLYASFLQAYGIDLRKTEMHWWLFLELFRGLPEDTILMKVIETRGKVAPKYADAEYKSNLRKAKRAVAIDREGNDAAALGNTLKAWAGV